MARWQRGLWLLGGWCLMGAAHADHNTPAELVVTDRVVKPAAKVPPLGVNNWGGSGAVQWAANNFVRHAGNEPVYWRNLHRAKVVGPGWFEIDGPGTSWWQLWNSGFLSGAKLRIYRLVDKEGKPLPPRPDGNNLQLERADRAAFVGTGQVLPEGSPGFPDGGWIASQYADCYPNSWVRGGNLSAADASGTLHGRVYWYAVTAVGADGSESDLSNEVSAAPSPTAESGPRLQPCTGDDKAPALAVGAEFSLRLKAVGGKAPLRFEAAAPLPAGLRLDAGTGVVSGRPTAAGADVTLVLKVTDADGKSDQRAWVCNPTLPTAKGKPQPPRNLTARAGDGMVVLRWQPSPSDNVVAYKLKRSTMPRAEQLQRVYVTADTPKLEPWDYVVFERRFGNFDMKYVNPRVRGIGNPMDSPGMFWNADASRASLALVEHPQPLPAEMVEPGETCLRVTAKEGPIDLSQTTMIGTGRGGESLWYGLLEPGRHYLFEGWLRQEGLADGGQVTFSFGRGYPGIRHSFTVDGTWRRYRCEFDGPERPAGGWHFGQTLSFAGPGTLWLDNLRLARIDTPADADKRYVPNKTVLAELLRVQPPTGPKAAHRIWFLNKDATMASLTSWHANAKVWPDWSTRVEGTMEMTLPMGLAFDLATGDAPATRMRPWLVLQHLLHSEDDWRGLVEYLAAPYDPAKDTPRAKPWAAKRYAQRGVGTPWVDEFSQVTIEFGNETWHNGIFADWIGFSTRNAVHQGGREYGLFMRYLIGEIKKSPYWTAGRLDQKIRFSLGANYDGRVDRDGSVRGYGEEAMQACPEASVLGHANYVGPKWETGDYSARKYDDHGVQECLLSFLTGPDKGQQRMSGARDQLLRAGLDYDIAAYEGGPGGFALPGQAPPEQVETNERYGKSLAQAVGAFDAWMRSYAQGWTDQCYLGYDQGNHWASHMPFQDGFRASPAFEALGLRNRARGDLMAVEERSMPTFQRGKDTYPLVGAYALRDGDRWALFVVSRKLDGRHDNQDFGDGAAPVTLRLPFARAGAVTLHKLTADPRLTNRDKLNVTVQQQDLPAGVVANGTLVVDERTGGVRGGMPPGSILLYVCDGAR
jgi:hypothetical protein